LYLSYSLQRGGGLTPNLYETAAGQQLPDLSVGQIAATAGLTGRPEAEKRQGTDLASTGGKEARKSHHGGAI
jgi:hypothetical protein